MLLGATDHYGQAFEALDAWTQAREAQPFTLLDAMLGLDSDGNLGAAGTAVGGATAARRHRAGGPRRAPGPGQGAHRAVLRPTMEFQNWTLASNARWKLTDEQLALLRQAESPNARTRYTMKSVRTVRNLFARRKATTHAAPMGRTQPHVPRLLGGPHLFNGGVSEESVRLGVRTTLPVTAARLLDDISTSVPVIRGLVSCDLGAASPPESRTEAIERPELDHGVAVHWGHAFGRSVPLHFTVNA